VSAERPIAAGPAAAGFRWPAEWEPHAATWLSWPHNLDTWPGRLEQAERAFVEIVAALSPHEEVRINVVGDRMEDRVRARLAARGVEVDRAVRFFQIPTDDAWVRDHGPIFVVGEGPPGEREVALHDFGFNAWGGKYPPWDRDNAVPAKIAELAKLQRFESSWVLEGGSIDGNGDGCILTTESCLLNPNRNRGADGRAVTREDVEQVLADTLGATDVVWLAEGIAGDDTDGHIDDIARFVALDRVVAAVEDDASDTNHHPLQKNFECLQAFRGAQGQAFDVVALPMPPALVLDGQRCPASYANFYLANNVALVPTFDVPSDTRAIDVLRDCLPGREVIAIDSRDLVLGLGAIHCLTQQLPR
jgi:agmatine deiminase